MDHSDRRRTGTARRAPSAAGRQLAQALERLPPPQWTTREAGGRVGPALDVPVVFTREQARACGLSDRQIDVHLQRGRLVAVRRGLLALPGRAENPAAQHPACAVPVVQAHTLAALRSTSRPVVVSHAAAAQAWGLPSPLGGWPPLTVTTDSGPTRRRRDLHVVVAPLDDDEVVLASGGIPVTSLARTVADCLRTLRPYDALATADAAGLRWQLSRQSLDAAIARAYSWPGIVVARRLSLLFDARRESPFESWSAWSFDRNGVTPSGWQVRILDERGRHLARSDCWWAEGLAGEADGRSKYRLAAAERGGASAQALALVLADERRRERGLRRVGARVIRWEADDVLQDPRSAALATAIRDERRLAARDAFFRGSVR